MKNVLLATTAIALTAGYAAADVSYSASAKLAYGNFGTGHSTAHSCTYGMPMNLISQSQVQAKRLAFHIQPA